MGRLMLLDLPQELLMDITYNYLSLIDSYNFARTCKTIFQFHSIPNSEILLNFGVGDNNIISRKRLQDKCFNVINTLNDLINEREGKEEGEMINVFNTSLFKSFKFEKISSSCLNEMMDILFSDNKDFYSLAQLNGPGELKINSTQWNFSIGDYNKNTVDKCSIQLIPLDFSDSSNNNNENSKAKELEVISNNKLIVSLPKGVCTMNYSLDMFDWTNSKTTQILTDSWTFPVNFDEEIKQPDYNDYIPAINDRGQTITPMEESRLGRLDKYSATNGNYMIIFPNINIDRVNMDKVTFKCYKKNGNNQPILIWAATFGGKLCHMMLSPLHKIQISNSFIMIPIQLNFSEPTFHILIFWTETGTYLGSYEIPYDPDFYAVYEPNEFMTQFYNYGSHIFLKMYILENQGRRFSISRFKICYLSIDLFLSQLELKNDNININVFKFNTSLSAIKRENLWNQRIQDKIFKTNNNDWKILFKSPSLNDLQSQLEAENEFIKLWELNVRPYFWNETIALLITYFVYDTRDISIIYSMVYLFLYNMETGEKKHIVIDDGSSNNIKKLIMVDDRLNFTILNNSFVEKPIS